MRTAVAARPPDPPTIADEVLEAELAYIRRVIGRMTRSAQDREELLSAANLGLARAVLSFNHKDPFPNFARVIMCNAMRDTLRAKNWGKRAGITVSIDDVAELVDTLTPERMLILAEDASEAYAR